MSNLRVHSRIYVVGFMGSGKTMRGREMAELLNYQFVDLDQFVEAAAGKSIPQIVKESGEEAFPPPENQSLRL